jgi:hypothetical protein
MGFKQDNEERKAAKEGVETSGKASKSLDDCDDDLGYMGEPLHDEVSLYNWKNPVMILESRYKDMPTFRLRQLVHSDLDVTVKGVGVHGELMQELKYQDHQPSLYVF